MHHDSAAFHAGETEVVTADVSILDLGRLGSLVGCSATAARRLLLRPSPDQPAPLRIEGAAFDTPALEEDLPPTFVHPPPRVSCALVTAAHRLTSLDTKALPKELIRVADKALIVHCLEQLAAAGMQRVVRIQGSHSRPIGPPLC